MQPSWMIFAPGFVAGRRMQRIIKRAFDVLLNSSDGDALGRSVMERAMCNKGSSWSRIWRYSSRQASIVSPLLIRSTQLSRAFDRSVLIPLLLSTHRLPERSQASHLQHSYGSLTLAHNLSNFLVVQTFKKLQDNNLLLVFW